MMLRYLIILGVLCSGALALPTGAPDAACDTMTPDHGIDGQDTSIFDLNYFDIKCELKGNGDVQFKLKGLSGQKFKGLLLQIRDGSGNKIGTFYNDDLPDGFRTACGDEGVTHTRPDEKDRVTIVATVDPDYQADAICVFTLVEEKEIFWVQQELPARGEGSIMEMSEEEEEDEEEDEEGSHEEEEKPAKKPSRPGMGRPGKGRPGKGRPGKGRPDKARPGMGRPGKRRPGMDSPGMGGPGMDKRSKGRPGKSRPGMGSGEPGNDRRKPHKNFGPRNGERPFKPRGDRKRPRSSPRNRRRRLRKMLRRRKAKREAARNARKGMRHGRKDSVEGNDSMIYK